MKKTLLFLTLAVIGFASCKKEENTYNAAPYVPPYHVEGLTDLVLQKTGNPVSPTFKTLNLRFIYENQEQEKITLSIEGTPQGMFTSLSDSIGYPSFVSTVDVIDTATTPGNYTLKLVVKGNATGRREYPFNVKVVAAPVLNNLLAANGYSCYTSCGTGNRFTQNITAVAGTTDRILFSNFDDSGNQIQGIVTPDPLYGPYYGTITIPSQTVNGVTYYSATSSSNYYNIGGSSSHNVQIEFRKSTSNYPCTLNMTL